MLLLVLERGGGGMWRGTLRSSVRQNAGLGAKIRGNIAGVVMSDPPSQSEVQDIPKKLDELITAVRR